MTQSSLDLAIQIHGGAGYTRDFLVEQLYRDNRLNPIHEGTTGIQANDLVGRKIRRDGEASFRILRQRVQSTLERAVHNERLQASARSLELAWRSLDQAVELLIEETEALATANATPFLFAFGHAVVGWLWLDVALLCDQRLRTNPGSGELAYYSGKLQACRYFTEYELPRVTVWLAPLFARTAIFDETTVAQLVAT